MCVCIHIYMCIYISYLLYPFICWWTFFFFFWWTFRLLPCLGYGHGCYKHWGYTYLFKLEFLSFLDICLGVGLLDHIVTLFSVFKLISILFSIVTAPIYIPTNSVGGSLFPTPSPGLTVCRLFDDGHSDWCEVIPHIVLTCISLIISKQCWAHM